MPLIKWSDEYTVKIPNWFVDHILIEDKKHGLYQIKSGVQYG